MLSTIRHFPTALRGMNWLHRSVQRSSLRHSSVSSYHLDHPRLFSSHIFQITQIDHLALTVRDLDKTVDFYTQALGMEVTTFKGGRKALNFGNQKINLHEISNDSTPKADRPTPGSGDLCFITNAPLEQVAKHFKECNVQIIEGPIEKTGAVGSIKSVYVRDPDGNLIEVSNYIDRIQRL